MQRLQVTTHVNDTMPQIRGGRNMSAREAFTNGCDRIHGDTTMLPQRDFRFSPFKTLDLHPVGRGNRIDNLRSARVRLECVGGRDVLIGGPGKNRGAGGGCRAGDGRLLPDRQVYSILRLRRLR